VTEPTEPTEPTGPDATTPGGPATSGWTALVPVRRTDAKTRLAGHPRREDLVVAMARDVLDALRATSAVHRVVLVTDDGAVGDRLGVERGDVVVAGQGLDRDLEAGAGHAAAAATLGLVVVMADLPALRPEHLTELLSVAPRHGCGVVADQAGVGTTLLTASAGQPLAPSYGAGSFERHRRGGAIDLTSWAAPGARHDVDTVADLARLLSEDQLRPGRHTAHLLDAAGPTSTLRDVPAGDEPTTGFATVRSFDPQTRQGRLLLDDGHELSFGAAAFDAGGLLQLRLGQRVRIQRAGDEVVTVTLSTYPVPGTDPRSTGLGRP